LSRDIGPIISFAALAGLDVTEPVIQFGSEAS
jgi:hypothetical protein